MRAFSVGTFSCDIDVQFSLARFSTHAFSSRHGNRDPHSFVLLHAFALLLRINLANGAEGLASQERGSPARRRFSTFEKRQGSRHALEFISEFCEPGSQTVKNPPGDGRRAVVLRSL
jgi:hypothetical protein